MPPWLGYGEHGRARQWARPSQAFFPWPPGASEPQRGRFGIDHPGFLWHSHRSLHFRGALAETATLFALPVGSLGQDRRFGPDTGRWVQLLDLSTSFPSPDGADETGGLRASAAFRRRLRTSQ